MLDFQAMRDLSQSRHIRVRFFSIPCHAPWVGCLSAKRNEALHRLAALGKRDALSSASPVASSYERGAAS
jgi:hypothetical protein